MKNKEIKSLAEKIINLEQKCQAGKNIAENLKKMEQLVSKLSVNDILQLSLMVETNFS